MQPVKKRDSSLAVQNKELQVRLAEAEETLRAIRTGEVDALVLAGPKGEQVYTLQGAETPYRLLMESMSEGALTLSLDGTVLYCNRCFAELVQTPAEQVIGSSFFRFVAATQRPDLRSLVSQALPGIAKGEYTLCAGKEGNTSVAAQLSLRRLELSGMTVLAVVATDLTERKQHEEKLRALNAQLQERIAELAASNAELETFTYSVSHDLRAPLRQVVGFIRLLEKTAEGKLDEECTEYMGLIYRSAMHMGRLVDDLLSFSRVGRAELRLERVDLRAVLDQALQNLKPDAKAREIEWQIGPLPTVEGDPTLLQQVLANLLDNALKFTRPRPQVRIEVGCLSKPTEHVIFMRDNGVGFDPRYADKLFGVFQRLHSAQEFEGTGIGLASVLRIVRRHGGRAWAESAPGKGATVYFSLPLKRSSP